MSTPPLSTEPEWPSELGCYDVERPVTRRAAAGRDLAGRPVWLHWSPCTGDRDDPCGAEREYRALSVNPALTVPEVLDLVRQPGRCWAVTEVVEGISLAQAIAEGREVDIPRVAASLLAALRRSHAAGWVHGDVKPANVILRPDGTAVLVDWELATRVGRPAPPGSLGYAPPHAWEGGYRAETKNDTYSLAVLLTELDRGERLFTGDRSSVVAAQRTFVFDTDAQHGEVIGRVVAAANAGIGAEAADLPLDGALLAMREDQVLRLSTHAAASAIVGAVQRAAPACAETVAFEDQGHQLVRAVAERWRTSMDANAIVVDGSACHVAPPDDETSSTDLDRARRRWHAAGRVLAARLSALSPGVVFVDDSVARDELSVFVEQLGTAFAESGSGAWRVVTVGYGDVDAVSRGATRGAVRDALQVALATSHVAGALCEAIVRARPRLLRPALGVIADLARDGGLVGSAGQVELASHTGAGERSWLDVLDRRLASLGARASDALTDTGGGPMDRAQQHLLRGDVLSAYPMIVRATTELLGRDVSHEAECVRVADLWLEYGSTEAASAVLDRSPGGQTSVPVLRRRGRVAASRGDAASLRGVVTDLVVAGCEPGDMERQRFQAIVHLADGDPDTAHAVLGATCRAGRGTSEPLAWAEALATWGNVAKARGRTHSSRRLLRLARACADECGAMRVVLRIDGNLLSADSRCAEGSAMAASWADLATRCKRWGLFAAARRHLVRASTLYIAADDQERTEQTLASARAAGAAGGHLPPIWGAMEDYIDAQLHARRDVPVPRADGPPARNGSLTEWRLWLASHLAEVSLAAEVDLLTPHLPAGSRAIGPRLSRLLQRWVGRGGDASSRVARAVPFISGAYGEQAPAVGSLARYLTRGASDDWPLVGLLAVLRDALEVDEAVRELALALHAAGFVWGGVADSAAATWLRTHAPDIDAGRPYGMFAWEWRLAMLRADTILGHEPDVDTRLEGVLDALESWSAALPPDQRAQRMQVVPFATIAATAGLAAPEHLRIPTGGEPLVAFRAHLRREAVRFRGSRGRAAGLERVLHSALRLRSGCTIEDVLQETVSGVLAVCRAERAVVVYEDAAGDRRAKLATLERLEDVGPSDAEISQSAIEHARLEGRACIFDDACGNAEFGDSPSVRLYRPRSLMIAPLQAHGETLGYLYVENRSLPKSFSQSDLQLLEGFASQAGLALDNARLVEELRTSLDELKRVRTEAVRAESLRVLGQMAGEVAHDFNNLLAVVLGETQLLLQDQQDAGIERSLEVIERAAMDGAAAIRRIQSSTRARPREEFAVVDLGELVREVLDFTRVRWASGGNDPSRAIRTRCRTSRGVYVSGLAPELREVFTNLVLNAVDAMPDGGDLLVAVRAIGDAAEVEVRDAGKGIPPEIVDRVFDPFFSTKGESGNGLGLAIAKEIVERHGGTIAVTSTPGRGTTLAVTLPAVEQQQSESPEASRPRGERPERAASEGRTVLVVDDEEGVLRVLSTMLRADGFEVTSAASGEEATRRLESGERFDVVITDLYMPGTSGVEVIATTRRTAGARRVVVMSGYGDVVGEGRIARESVDGVLAKPFTLADVRDAVG